MSANKLSYLISSSPVLLSLHAYNIRMQGPITKSVYQAHGPLQRWQRNDGAASPYITSAAGGCGEGAGRGGQVTAAIVTCGGLCPGLNDVVQNIVYTLADYGVPTDPAPPPPPPIQPHPLFKPSRTRLRTQSRSRASALIGCRCSPALSRQPAGIAGAASSVATPSSDAPGGCNRPGDWGPSSTEAALRICVQTMR